MNDRKILWEGKTIHSKKSILFIEDDFIREEYTYEDGNSGIFSLGSFLYGWKRGMYTGPPLPEEVKVEIALREIKR